MKRVFQQIIDRNKGDCFSACLASILELKIEEVPKFMWHFKNYEKDAVNLWLATMGYGLLRVRWPEEITTGKDIPFHAVRMLYCIGSGKSPRGNWNHAIVGCLEAYTFKMIHDPHPSGLGIVGQPTSYNFLVPIDPTLMMQKPDEPYILKYGLAEYSKTGDVKKLL